MISLQIAAVARSWNHASFAFFTGRQSLSFSLCSIICHRTSDELIRSDCCSREISCSPAPARTPPALPRGCFLGTCLFRRSKLRPSCNPTAQRTLLSSMVSQSRCLRSENVLRRRSRHSASALASCLLCASKSAFDTEVAPLEEPPSSASSAEPSRAVISSF